MTQIITANTYSDGTFRNKDDAYQLITWSDNYELRMTMIYKDDTENTINLKGDYDYLKKVYDANIKNCVYANLAQIRILGATGKTDTSTCAYKTSGKAVKKGTEFVL